MTQRDLQRIQTRRKLYECAIALFNEKSFHEVKVKDIVNAAGVSTGAFYHHFPSKEDIIDEGYRIFDKDLEKKYSEENPKKGIETILFLFEGQLNYVESMGVDMASVFFKNQLGIKHDYLFNETRFLYESLLDNTQYINNTSLSSQDITNNILRLSRGIIYDWCLHKGNYNLKEICMKNIKIYLEYYHLI